jgi:putative endonuclease
VTTARQRLGSGAERAAADYLQARGYRVLAMNQRVGRGELDIIARRGSVLVFAEVKARRSGACGAPEEAVTPRKQHQVARLAELWLAARPGALAGVTEVRFDVLAVDLRGTPAQIRHLPAAFEAS